tara:strand:+ start:697 stop:1362 length:666 start_codon:yes stop_codon:yes gene_type:complete
MIAPIDFLIDNMMLPFLKFSYATIFPNYAVGIILLTIIIKLALYPLTQKQFQSMKAMQTLQPKMKELREKYKKNPQKLQQEMLKMYQETGINPLGGCLPMLVQLPFLFALFYTMNSDKFNVLISEEGVFPGLFSFWLPNLSQPDHLYILPIIIGLATYYSQKLMPVQENSPQTKIMAFLPAFMVVICFKMPAGVLLYWASSQIISAVQQVSIMKSNKGVVS